MTADADLPRFRPVDAAAMESILPYLSLHKSRSCDFSYGGILMWVEMFNYEYAIFRDTLYIKGRAPGDGEHTESTPTFTFPLGPHPLEESVDVLRRYCAANGLELEFSSVPEQEAAQLMALGGKEMKELPSWEDYIYDAAALATLAGKKMSKKRNHLNRFISLYPDWNFRFMEPKDVAEVRRVISRDVELEGAQTPEARTERRLADILLTEIEKGNRHLFGGLLCIGDQVVGYTIGDVVGDTLHIHVEKAERAVSGSFEAINKLFAEAMCARFPRIQFINREDDAGDPGLRYAKQTYHPLYLLKKYNITF